MSDTSHAASERRSMRMVWKTLRLRHVGLAFFWACSMLTFRSSILLSGAANSTDNQTLVVIVSFVANMTTLFFIASRIERDPTFFERLRPSAFTASIIAGLVLMAAAGPAAISGLLGAELVLMPVAAGAVLAGIGYGYYWGSWAEYLGRIHPSRTSFYVPVAFFVTATLYVVLSMGADFAGIPALMLMIPLPVLTQLCLTRCKREVPQGRYARNVNAARYRTALGSLVSLIVASLVLSCLFGFVWQMTVISVDSANDAHRLPLMANIVAAVGLIGLVVLARTRIDLSFAFRVLVPVLVILFAVMPFFWETNPVILNTIMSVTYGVFDVIIWYMVVSTAYDFAVSGFVIGGIVRALSIIARLVGIGIGYVIMLIPESPSMLIVGVSVGAVYVLAMLVVFQSTRHRFSFFHPREQEKDGGVPTECAVRDTCVGCATVVSVAPGALEESVESPAHKAALSEAAGLLGTSSGFDTPGVPASSESRELRESDEPGEPRESSEPLSTPDSPTSLEQVFDNIAEYYSLTRREAEVLPFLARGRSAKVIAEALFVSESTIRTHTRRILEKTALHSKQELIDLIEHYE